MAKAMGSRPNPGSRRRKALLGALALLSLSSGALGARAAAGAVVAELGEGLGRLSAAAGQNASETVQLNGLSFQIRVISHSKPPAAVLAELQRRCRKQVGERASATSGLLSGLWARNLGAWTEPSAEGVSVLCASSARAALPLRGGLERLMQNGDVSEWLDLQLAWIQPSEEGTREVRVEPQGSLNWLAAFPKAGDAPGFDPPELERLPGGRRVLSGFVGQHGVWAFEHAHWGKRDLIDGYREVLQAAGYRPDPRFESPEAPLVFWCNKTPLSLVVEEHADGPPTAVLLRGPWALAKRHR